MRYLVMREWKNEKRWMEFWNDEKTARKNALNCEFCKHSIYEQLSNKEDFVFFYPARCWKAYAYLDSLQEAFSVTGQLYLSFNHLLFHGKFSIELRPVFFLYASDRKDALEWKNRLLYVIKSVKEVRPDFEAKIRRGCEGYESIFGPWQFWKEKMKVKYGENVEEFLKAMENVV